MSQKGILLVIAQPTSGMEEEFNAWYDTEHLPERLALPGFESARRFVAASGARRYLALYDLDRPEALDTPEYAKVSGANFSPWTIRVTGRSRVQRAAGRQAYPGQSVTGGCARLLLIRFRGLAADAEPLVVAGMRGAFESRPEAAQVRVFACPRAEGVDYFGLVECRSPTPEAFDPTDFGAAAGGIDLIETFAPY